MILNSPTISGSLTVTGNIIASGSITLSGSVASSSFASTASFVALAQSASNAVSAQTASFANAFTVASTLTAQTLVVQTITSSVDFVTGSTRFGSILDNTHIFSGSVTMNPGGLFVSSSGLVGIGTTSPNDLLEVRGYVRLSAGAGSAPQFSIFSNNQTTGSVTLSQGFSTATDNIGYLFNRANADFVFGTNNTERMRITSGGNVGIGTTPSYKLDIRNDVLSSTSLDPVTIRLYNNSDGGSAIYFSNGVSGQSKISFGVESTGAGTDDTYLGFSTGPNATLSERMRITSGGNVGIGTSSPKTILQINAGTGSYPTLGTNVTNAFFVGRNDGIVGMYLGYAADGNGWIQQMRNDSATAYNLILQPVGGNVGIGTTTPSYKLDVVSLGSPSARVRNGDLGGTATLLLETANNFSGTCQTYIQCIGSVGNGTSTLVFGTAGTSGATTATERMRISSAGTISIASGGNIEIDNGYLSTSAGSGITYSSKLFTSYNYPYIDTYLDSVAGASYEGRIIFRTNTGGGAFGNRMIIYNSGAVVIQGALSKGSGSFRIKHPLASKKNTHQLVHSFIEGPQADLIYSGGVTLVDGKATINIDEAATMTEGTFEALNRNIRVFTSNETSWDNVRGKVVGNILTIECQNTESTDEISWMVIGERQDEHIMDTEWTDENGKVIVEPLIPAEPEQQSQINELKAQ